MTNEIQTAPTVKNSYFMDKIFPSLVTAALAAGFGLIGMYFAVNALSTRVSALEAESVRKDVLLEALSPIKTDLTTMKTDVSTTKTDVAEIKGILRGTTP